VVTTRRRTDVVHVLVEDDGPGLGRIPTGSGVGLRETRRVLRELGGDLSLTIPGAGRGTRVLVSLPLQEPWIPRSVTASAG
jgi:glucose-6-phosphate-specific signal transduction histidine kinase